WTSAHRECRLAWAAARAAKWRLRLLSKADCTTAPQNEAAPCGRNGTGVFDPGLCRLRARSRPGPFWNCAENVARNGKAGAGKWLESVSKTIRTDALAFGRTLEESNQRGAILFRTDALLWHLGAGRIGRRSNLEELCDGFRSPDDVEVL